MINRKIVSLVLLAAIMVVALPSAVFAVSPTDCSSQWSIALQGRFTASDGESDLTSARGSSTVDQLLTAVHNGCDLKMSVKFTPATPVGQGAHTRLSFMCSTVEGESTRDGAMIVCYSPVRRSAFGATDNDEVMDEVTIHTYSGTPKISYLRHTLQYPTSPIVGNVNPFPAAYGSAEVRFFTRK